MLLKDVFEDIFTGYNMTNALGKKEVSLDHYFIQKDSIQYTNIIKEKLIKKRVVNEVKDKYFMRERDIIISLKKPYKVGTYRYLNLTRDKTVIIPNNFIVLRGINMDKYSFIFVANYLEKIGIDKYVKENGIDKRSNKELTLLDVKNIELPDIAKEEQMKISKLMNNINDRSAIYNTILENDDQIIKYALNKVVGDNSVR